MTRSELKKILNCPSKNLLNLALDLVNLKDKELRAITLMDIQGKTREETAELMNISVQAVSNIRDKAFIKLNKVWSKEDLIKEILEL